RRCLVAVDVGGEQREKRALAFVVEAAKDRRELRHARACRCLAPDATRAFAENAADAPDGEARGRCLQGSGFAASKPVPDAGLRTEHHVATRKGGNGKEACVRSPGAKP